MSSVEVIGPLQPSWAWDGVQVVDPSGLGPLDPLPPRLRGAVGSVREAGSVVRMVRDPYGLGKLYWAWLGSALLVSARPARLVRAGIPFPAIRALPPGTVVDVDPLGVTVVPTPGAWVAEEGTWSTTQVAAEVGVVVEAYLHAVARRAIGRTAVVCLSGGMDSTLIAVLALRCFDRVVAVSFDLRGLSESEDRKAARLVADELGIELIEADATPAEVLARLDLVLVEGIDWRPYNVHAALVNAVLADRIASLRTHLGADAVVLTGDLANELLADYRPEVQAGRVHYRLPEVAPRRLRAALVAGLESTHREIGVFDAFGLELVQPYALAIDPLLRLDPSHLGAPSLKAELVAGAADGQFPLAALGREKVRAQIGGPEGGVLAVVEGAGLDEARLRTRFAELHGTDVASVARAWRTGRYRSSVPAVSSNA